MIPRLAVAVCIAVVISQPLSTQSPTWTQRSPAVSPPSRNSAGMAYDQVRQRIVLFGGGSFGSVLGDTWEWDGTNWLQRTPPVAPGPVASPSMAYDTARQRVVLFGGVSAGGAGNSGTWEWDGATWLLRASASNPSPRSGAPMVCDTARNRLVLYGGMSAATGYFLADTWEWDGTNWLARTPAQHAGFRFGHAMAYDIARQRTVLFGGAFAPNVAWEWDGSNWTQSPTTTNPGPSAYGGMVYDASWQRVVLYGGQGVLFGTTWQMDGLNWYRMSLATEPGSWSGHAMAYDVARQCTVLFGGTNGSATWELGGVPMIATSTSYGSGCGAPPLGLMPVASARPVLGSIAGATVVNVPSSLVGVAIGFSNQAFGATPLPLPLAAMGMPGCDLLQSNDAFGFATTPSGASTRAFAHAIPSAPSLLGQHAYVQAYAFAPGANPLGLLASNGLDWLFGDL